ncbi:conserved hypothetical protein [Vibrio nigripulchritudo SFn27]|nr:hypothetical protein [Vibrio nigripulchritudo]CCN82729.1 conserved hypothetical protein [Vibrio nigripulchritudo BLFn1]CCN89879.1 conserved hypothetical protein [Vibrio nigripulchritudo SFn27]CCN92276.1 conserved hypothetical protein [Vibrio nigripulchritudo ENn2]CCO43763.1 conserved hypothetical protein [Vibrio nigripulchritudo SFn135]CCO53077.1 conserved hypothetical protein [Vibrio nigripulchritudo Wn13]
MAEMFDWRELSVYRDVRFESLEERFCSTKGAESDTRIFKTVKELMVLAALVGYQLGEYEPLKSKTHATPIKLGTYAKTGHDAYIYLIALAKEPSLDMLKDENLRDAIGIFEGYCNSGLKHIDSWIMNNIGEPLVTNILFNQTLKYLIENE